MRWKAIKGYEGLYEVSDTGLVRGLKRHTTGKRNRKLKAIILKQTLTTTGYLKCELSKDGKKVSKKVHRLVAQAFIANPHNLPVVNHKDLNPLNNDASNLEWCTQAYNIHHAKENGHSGGTRSILTEQQKKEIDEKYVKYNREFGAKYFANKYGVSDDVIRNYVRRTRTLKENL